MIKDKLDKTLEELKKGKKGVEKTTNVIYGQCARCGGSLTNDHICKEVGNEIAKEIDKEIIENIIEEVVKNQQLEWVGSSKIEQRLQEPIQQVGVKDTYLPFVLTKLKICGTNTDARKLISTGKVKINNNVVNMTYSTKELSNFLLVVDGVKYEIFKVD